MKISYNWLKWYIPEMPTPEKLAEVFTFHICEVESFEKLPDGDVIFDLKILPNRAHDLLSHQGVARELASVLDIKFVDPIPKYKVPKSKPTKLKISILTNKDRRHVGRIVRNIKVGPSPEWMTNHLASIGQRSINNIVDATNIVMFDCGQPTHAFDLGKIEGEELNIRDAKDGEKVVLLTGEEKELKNGMIAICDKRGNILDTGIKGGKYAEITNKTNSLILEADNFDPIFARKTGQALNIATDAKKRFENDLSPELAPYAMLELSALIFEMCPDAIFEDIIDTYPQKQQQRKISVSVDYINKRLGSNFLKKEIENVWKKLNFKYTEKNGEFEIAVPFLRVDITGPHDLVEDLISVLGYDRLEEKMPKIKLESKVNEIFSKMYCARKKLLAEGYSEVMTYTFRNKGEVEVLASASDKKFLRTNLTDGLRESMKLNQANAPLLGVNEIKIFEIGTVFSTQSGSASDGKKIQEEMHVAYGNKKEIKEMTLEKYISENPSFKEHGYFSTEKFLVLAPSRSQVSLKEDSLSHFKMWSLFPFIARDIAVWVPENINSEEVKKIIIKNMGNMVVRGPELFDKFKKGNQISFAFRLVFQSYDRTLTDDEVNETMTKITNKLKENKDWQVR
jgi:phenylalanyl-tRNA synthetase beta chain